MRRVIRHRAAGHETRSSSRRCHASGSFGRAATGPGGRAQVAVPLPGGRAATDRAEFRGRRIQHPGAAIAHPASSGPRSLFLSLSLRRLRRPVRADRGGARGRAGPITSGRRRARMRRNTRERLRVEAAVSVAAALHAYRGVLTGSLTGVTCDGLPRAPAAPPAAA